jgi:hypothetical protein
MELTLELITWLLGKGVPYPTDIHNIMTKGSIPIEEYEYDRLLRSIGLEVYNPNSETEILVLGREGWDIDSINRVLDFRSGSQLRAYSQEMFLAYLISGNDPLLEDNEQVRLLAGDHPGLKFLEDVGFQWPTTQVPIRGESDNFPELPYKRPSFIDGIFSQKRGTKCY